MRRSARISAPCCSRPAAPDEAEAVYWEDLKKNPENAWSLAGLAQALKAQNKNDEAAGIESRLKKLRTTRT